MSDVIHAFGTFFAHLEAISWQPLFIALLCQVLKTGARTRAQRNILAAAYPDVEVRWRHVFGAYLAGAGVNSLLPARGGDVLRLYLVRHRIEGATYATLASAIAVETIFDLLASTALLVWALHEHVLPGVSVIHKLPAVDWFWLFRNPRYALIVAATALLAGFVFGIWAAHRFAGFRERVSQGFAVLHTPGGYLRGVLFWQAVDWLLRLVIIFLFLRAFHIPANVGNAVRVQVTQSLSTILPITPAGIGTEQALVVYVLSGQATRAALLSFSVGAKFALSISSLVLGSAAIMLMLRTLRWRRLVGKGEQPAHEPGS